MGRRSRFCANLATDWHDRGISVDNNPLWRVVESGDNTGCGYLSKIRDCYPSVNNVRDRWCADEVHAHVRFHDFGWMNARVFCRRRWFQKNLAAAKGLRGVQSVATAEKGRGTAMTGTSGEEEDGCE